MTVWWSANQSPHKPGNHAGRMGVEKYVYLLPRVQGGGGGSVSMYTQLVVTSWSSKVLKVDQ